MTRHVTIDLREADRNSRTYGVLMESVTTHVITGHAVHNSGFSHIIQVWRNLPSRARGADPDVIVDPSGKPTTKTYSYLTQAQTSVISSGPAGQSRPRGDALQIGDVVTLRIYGYSLDTFQVRAQNLRDPKLVPVDLSNSASRQHFIDTGEYLTPAEARVAEYRGRLVR